MSIHYFTHLLSIYPCIGLLSRKNITVPLFPQSFPIIIPLLSVYISHFHPCMDHSWIIYGLRCHKWLIDLWIIYLWSFIVCICFPSSRHRLWRGNFDFSSKALVLPGSGRCYLSLGGARRHLRLGVTTGGYCKSMCILYVYTMDGSYTIVYNRYDIYICKIMIPYHD